MGAWGNKLFDDDTACDVRDEYVRLLSEGHAGQAATKLLLDSWRDSIADPDDGPIIWLALAATQHKHGRLEPDVKNRALSIIDQQLGLDRWREIDAHSVRARLKQLDKVRVLLLSPQPKEKRVAPPFRDSCSWSAGDIVGYRLNSGRLALIAVQGTETHAKGVSPVCELLDWRGDEPPDAAKAGQIGVRRGVVPPESLISALAADYPDHAADPNLARQRLLADIGLIQRPKDATQFDFSQVGAVTQTIYKLMIGDKKVTEAVRRFARERKPSVLEPVTQFSLRREFKKSELPTKRVLKLRIRRPNVSPLGNWMVIRWYELDETLKNTFGI